MFILKSISQTVLPLLAATFLASTPLVTATEASGINPRYVTDQNVIYAKGGGKGGISGTFNNAAKGPKPPVQKWTTKPRLPLWKGQNPPPPPPSLTLKPKGAPSPTPTRNFSRLPQHFNYNAQRPLRFDFKRATK